MGRLTKSLTDATARFEQVSEDHLDIRNEIKRLQSEYSNMTTEESATNTKTQSLRDEISKLQADRDKAIKMLSKKAKEVGEISGKKTAESSVLKERAADLK